MADKGMLAKVRALLDTADSYENEGNLQASATYRAKADQLMDKYRIDQEEAIAVNPAIATPISVEVDLCGYGSKYKGHYNAIWYWIARHCQVESFTNYVYTENGYLLRAYVVGYEEDVRYAEMLFTSSRMVFMERLEPKVDPNLSDQVNAYRLRAAGIERIRIAEMMWGNTDKVFLGRVGRLYKAECEERGEPALLSGRGVTGKAYREQYADQFITTLHGRLWQARQAASAAGGGVELHGRQDRIKEAFYAAYPDQRPKPPVAAIGEAPECEKCKKSKRGQCQEHYVRVGRMSAGPDYNSVAAERGRMAGRAAARAVDLGRSSGRQGLEN